MAEAGGGPICRDAVIVIPGIMGSTLTDTSTLKTLWGVDSPGWYADAWLTGNAMELLHVTDDERTGRVGRIAATGLLRAAAFAPGLHGLEPYTELTRDLARILAHGDALREFPYDWRLSIEHNARELSKVADQHLSRWRTHEKGSVEARLILVAHSMGGLIARYFTHVLGGAAEVATTLTLGTPYYGAVKAAYIFNYGKGAPVPLPKRRLRRMARTMPGLHDLLPFYRCVDDGSTARFLTAQEAGGLGADAELAAESKARHERLMDGTAGSLRLLVGTDQPTMQSMRLADGVLTELFKTCTTTPEGRITGRENLAGDSTVFRRAAAAFDLASASLPQAHGSLAKTPEAISHVRDVLLNATAGPPLGVTELGVDVTDVIPLDQPLEVRVTGADADAASCRVFDATSGAQVAVAPLLRRDDMLVAATQLDVPGVYRVEVKAGGASAVVQYVMAADPDELSLAGDNQP
jgi:Lecithin:cholesterol acyltransferase